MRTQAPAAPLRSVTNLMQRNARFLHSFIDPHMDRSVAQSHAPTRSCITFAELLNRIAAGHVDISYCSYTACSERGCCHLVARSLICFAPARSLKHRRQRLLRVRQAILHKFFDSHCKAVVFDLMVCVMRRTHNYDWQLFIIPCQSPRSAIHAYFLRSRQQADCPPRAVTASLPDFASSHRNGRFYIQTDASMYKRYAN